MADDYKDDHDEGDVRATREVQQEMNCYLEETASGFFSSFNSGTLLSPDSIPRLDSKSPILHLWLWQILQI